MRKRASKVLIVAALATSAIACGASSVAAPVASGSSSARIAERAGDPLEGPPASPKRAANTCEERSAAAVNRLQAILDANQACTRDSDCISVDFAATCFDSCSRTIAASGKAAYEKARHDADANECAAYATGGCPRTEPPACAPPVRPTCHAGACR